jgi:hypothetical protein
VTTSEEVSPNGQLKAVTFRRLCPEEHSITTHVSILGAKETLPDGNGNVFGYDNEIAIRVSWLSDSRLEVYTYADPAKATKIERAGNVSVGYSRIIETALVTPIQGSVASGSATPAGTASPASAPWRANSWARFAERLFAGQRANRWNPAHGKEIEDDHDFGNWLYFTLTR